MNEQRMRDLINIQIQLRLKHNRDPAIPREIPRKQKILKPAFKYYMKNDIAYTEDHIPVRKLHLFGMPMELTQDSLLDYFTRNYGQVLGLERIQNSVPADDEQRNLPTWNAYALFANLFDAAKVLRMADHKVSNHKFHVQASYSWLQPVAHEESNELEFSTSPHILELNDDCLECVFQYLELADQIRLARTCTRFRSIYQLVSARQSKSIDAVIAEDLTLWETLDFCQLSGPHVQSLNCWTNVNFMNCFYAGLYFPNLKELEVLDMELKVYNIQRILLGTNKLKKLDLLTQPRTDPLDLAQLKELKSLRITEWNTESLSLPTSIESLSFQKWHKFSCLPFILRNLTQIKKLQLLKSANVFMEMAGLQAFASVEVLQIECNHFFGGLRIAQLPKLKKLRLKFEFKLDIIQHNPQHLIQEIIEHNPQQLDHLEFSSQQGFYKEEISVFTCLIGLHTLVLDVYADIDSEVITKFGKLTELKRLGLYNSYITDNLLLQLMINCPKLSTLRMQNCRNVSENLVNSINSLVQKDIQNKENKRELPFKLYLDIKKIISTDHDMVDVFFKDSSSSEWFEEELKVKS